MNAAVSEVFETERDKRTMNHMDPETKSVHLRLEVWGRWAHEEVRAWPRITLLGRVIEQGVSGAGQQGRPPVSMPDEIARTDAAVARLGEIDRKVIRAYYLREVSKEDAARQVRMRVRQFQNVLRRARWRIGGFLAASEK